MEVHHHPDLHHKRKNFREYFLEFIMIFLAVTLGFFAENIREYFSDKSKEREYMQSLIEDLQKDTADLREVTAFWHQHIPEIDSLSDILKETITQKNIAQLLRLTYRFYRYDDIHYHNRTVQELQNAGLFRIVTNRKIASQISNYDKIYTDELKQQRDVLVKVFGEVTNLFPELINYNIMPKNPLIDSGKFYEKTELSNSLFSADAKLISRIQGKIYDLRFISAIVIYTEEDLLKQATALIEIIRKEYDLKPE